VTANRLARRSPGRLLASTATWLIDQVPEAETQAQAATRHDIQRLAQKLDQIEDQVRRLGR
jgi:hypothetical protein